MSLVDETLPFDEHIAFNVFSSKQEDLPQAKTGDIIRFHRVQVKKFNAKFQGVGNSKHGCSWVVFPMNELDALSISSNTFTFNDEDKNKVTKLREWWNNSNGNNGNNNSAPFGKNNNNNSSNKSPSGKQRRGML
jgi:hypothetical protein